MLGPQQAVGQPAHRCALPSDLRWNGPQRCNVIVERDLAQRSQPTLEACINGSPLGCNLPATPLAHLDVELTTAVEHVALAFTPPVLLLFRLVSATFPGVGGSTGRSCHIRC